jgi:DUF177 domain-containing protein
VLREPGRGALVVAFPLELVGEQEPAGGEEPGDCRQHRLELGVVERHDGTGRVEAAGPTYDLDSLLDEARVSRRVGIDSQWVESARREALDKATVAAADVEDPGARRDCGQDDGVIATPPAIVRHFRQRTGGGGPVRYARFVTTFNLRTAKLRPGEVFRETLPIELEPLELGGEDYVPVPKRPDAALEITRLPSGTLFELAFEASLAGPCFRCLEDASIRTSVRGREYQGSDSEESEQTTNPYLANDRLDLSSWARDAIALALPEKILCREDCAGLCSGCGANLNTEECRCPPPAPDLRFAKLAQLRGRL